MMAEKRKLILRYLKARKAAEIHFASLPQHKKHAVLALAALYDEDYESYAAAMRTFRIDMVDYIARRYGIRQAA